MLIKNKFNPQLPPGQVEDIHNTLREAKTILKLRTATPQRHIILATVNQLVTIFSNKLEKYLCQCDQTITQEHIFESGCWLTARERIANDH